jgi:hypothetical protein
MGQLNASAVSILEALFSLAVLTFVMGLWMSLVRMPAMRRAGIDLQEAAHTRDLALRLPSEARRVADNFNHLFEAPTVFYAVALAIVAAGLADPLYAACAWAFLGLRVLHSLVQATFNRVAVRAWLYGLSWAALAVMILRPLPALLGHA